MRDNDAVLALLGDVKEILYGIFLLVLAGFLCLIGTLLLSTIGGLLLAVGFFIGLAGLLYARHGFHHHDVVENEEPQT